MTDLAISSDALPVGAAEARRLTDQIKFAVDGVWVLITKAYTARAWDALGYGSWDEYCTREFGTSRLRLPREERAEVVASLRDSGLSLRAIEAATGISRPTIIKDLRGEVVNSSPPVPNGTSAAPQRPVFDEPVDLVDDLDFEPEPYDYPVPLPQPRPITGTDGKTYASPAPRPAPTAEQIAEQEYQDRLRRRAKRLIEFLNGWLEFENFRTLPERDDVLDVLFPHDREQLLAIERSLGWTTAA